MSVCVGLAGRAGSEEELLRASLHPAPPHPGGEVHRPPAEPRPLHAGSDRRGGVTRGAVRRRQQAAAGVLRQRHPLQYGGESESSCNSVSCYDMLGEKKYKFISV